VLDLIRIKILAVAGVPLSRINELLEATPEQLRDSTARIYEVLAQDVVKLDQRRARLADLAAGERSLLPRELVEFADELQAAGVSPEMVEAERDGWVLLYAAEPARAPEWLREKRGRLRDPEFRQLYRAYDEALGWDPDDPGLEELAVQMLRMWSATDRASASTTHARLLSWTPTSLSPRRHSSASRS
jgi:DNA-binding transcriptional MerR regulator